MTKNPKISRIKLLTNRILARNNTYATQINNSLASINDPKHFLESLATFTSNNRKSPIAINIDSIRQNRRLLISIASTLKAIQSDQSKQQLLTNKTDTVGDPLSIFKKKNENGLGGLAIPGILGLIGSAFSIVAKPIVSILKRINKWFGLFSRDEDDFDLSDSDDSNKKRKRKRRRFPRASFAKKIGTRVVTAAATTLGRFGTSAIARLGIGAAAAVVGGTAATAAGIALLASAVGFGAYKLGQYLKLSEKLDSLISKTTSGKYRDLADILLGIKSGDLASDISTWLKETAITFFDKGYQYIKGKIVGLLEKLNPFSAGKKANAVELQNAKTNEQLKAGTITESELQNNEVESEPDKSDEQSNISFNKPASSGGFVATATSMAESALSYGKSLYDKAVDGTSGLIEKGAGLFDAAKSAFGFGQPEAIKNSGSGKLTHFPSPIRELNSAFGRRYIAKNGRGWHWHNGVDQPVGIGTSIFSAGDGVVTGAGNSGSGGGNILTIDHGAGIETRYMHLSKFLVKRGDRVKGGQTVALSGNTGGLSTGPHLHFEIKVNGKHVNPINYFKFTGKTVMGKDGQSRKPTQSEINQGIGVGRGVGSGYATVKTNSIPGALQQSNSTEYRNINQNASRSNLVQHPRIQQDSNFSGMATIETESAEVKSPRIISASIAMASSSVYYT